VGLKLELQWITIALFKGITENYTDLDGTTKIMIVITDGQSNSGVADQAIRTKEAGIKAIAMGIGSGVNQKELEQIAGGKSGVMNINDYKALKCFRESLTSGVCTQHIEIANNRTVKSTAVTFDDPIYFEVKKGVDSNQKINLKIDENFIGVPHVNIFTSYDTPFPDINNNLQAHLGSNEGDKTLVVGTHEDKNSKGKLRFLENNGNSTYDTLYISVYAEKMNFNLLLEECDPKVCQVGTNDIRVDRSRPAPVRPIHPGKNTTNDSAWIIILVVALSVVLVVAGVFLYKCYKSRRARVHTSDGLLTGLQ